MRENLGGIYDFLRKKNLDTLQQLELSRNDRRPVEQEKRGEAPAVPAEEVKEKRALSYAEQREREKMLRRARKALEKAEADVERLETEQGDIEARIAAGAADPDTLAAYDKATRDLENAMSVWELAQQELESLQ